MSNAMKIRQCRKAHGLSQTAVASALGHTQNWLSLIERGLIKLDSEGERKVIAAIERLAQFRHEMRKALAGLPRLNELCEDLHIR